MSEKIEVYLPKEENYLNKKIPTYRGKYIRCNIINE